MSKLVIVESPTKAKTISKFLGKDFEVISSKGHVRDLPKSDLGVEVEKDFEPTYQISKGKQEIVRGLKKAAKDADSVFLATDPDREGEAIAWHVRDVILDGGKSSLNSSKFLRVVFHEITEEAINEAFKHPRDIDFKLVDSQQARRVLDRLVGYKLSPLLWKKVRYGLSAGRVQSVAVRLIVERERERNAFKPEEYWEVRANLAKQEPKSREFEVKLVERDGQKLEVRAEKAVNEIVAELEKADYQVASVEKKSRRRNPYPPFTTSTLQQAGVNVFGFSAKRTMRAAQRLYEAGLITYHRTDSTAFSDKALKDVRGFIGSNYGSKYLPESAIKYKTKVRLVQEAHEAIRPTDVGKQSAGGNDRFGKDEELLYTLIWGRAVACQMVPAVYEQSSVSVEAVGGQAKYLFKATGSKLLFDGWLRVNEGAGSNEGAELPELAEGEKLKLLGLIPSQHFTEPPARYTEATLIRALEEKGVGRPSTYAPTISTIQDRGYVSKDGRQLRPEDVGTVVNDLLVAYFPGVVDLSFTAGMEEKLDDIAAGKQEWVPIVRDFYGPFAGDLEEADKNIEKSSVTTLEETDEKCPECGKLLIVKLGKYGRFYSCSGFPDCKFIKPFVETIGVKCPGCVAEGLPAGKQGDVVVKRTRRGKIFYGCSRYPKCKWASWRRP